MLNRIGLDDVVHTNVMQSERWTVGTTYNYTHTQLYTDIHRYTQVHRHTHIHRYRDIHGMVRLGGVRSVEH